MNVYDSQRMTDALAADGYVATDAVEDADLVLLAPTISARKGAAEKVCSGEAAIRDMRL
ncbi:tRNA (N6-isopentenyl adenosine(37)-C2)-methylthiotransferase MiaB, partial [Mesorhizobium atlanticum]